MHLNSFAPFINIYQPYYLLEIHFFRDLEDTIDNVWIQIKTVINKQLEELKQNVLDEQSETTLKTHVSQIVKLDTPVRSLMWKRLTSYILLILRSNVKIPAPPGFTEFEEELDNFGTAFKRVTYYNYAVYGEYYHDILRKINSQQCVLVTFHSLLESFFILLRIQILNF